MRFIVIVKGSKDSEAGGMPTEQELREMGNFNDELANKGVMLAGEGLHPSSKGVRIHYSGSDRKVAKGPFPEPDQLVAGYWILKADSLDQVVEWIKKAPFQDGSVEIRQIFEAEDFGAEYTPELREQEDKQRARIEAQHGA